MLIPKWESPCARPCEKCVGRVECVGDLARSSASESTLRESEPAMLVTDFTMAAPTWEARECAPPAAPEIRGGFGIF